MLGSVTRDLARPSTREWLSELARSRPTFDLSSAEVLAATPGATRSRAVETPGRDRPRHRCQRTGHLLVEGPRTAAVESHLASATLLAPDLIGLEVLSALGRLQRAGLLTADHAEVARKAWQRTSVRRLPLPMVEERAWHLRNQVRISDAHYVACAEVLGAALLTCDARLARAPLTGVSILLVQ